MLDDCRDNNFFESPQPPTGGKDSRLLCRKSYRFTLIVVDSLAPPRRCEHSYGPSTSNKYGLITSQKYTIPGLSVSVTTIMLPVGRLFNLNKAFTFNRIAM